MGLEKAIEKRENHALRKESALATNTKKLQRALSLLFLERVIDQLETDESGGIKFNAANVGKVAKSAAIWSAYRKASNAFGRWVLKGLSELFGLNTAYMSEVADVTASREERTRQLLFTSLGYDLNKKEVISGTWLDALLAQEEVKRQVMDRLNSALRTRMNIDDFKRDFRDAMTDNKNGLGLVSKNMDFHARNIFHSFDRSAQEVYRQQLKLNWGLYSGTIMQPVKGKTKGTRGFCWQRVGNVYNADEIKKWKDIEFSGKWIGYNPFIHCGHLNCRHSWSWISEEMKKTLEERGVKINEYTPLPPGKTLKN